MNVDGIVSSERGLSTVAPYRAAPARLPTVPWAPRAARRAGGRPADGFIADGRAPSTRGRGDSEKGGTKE